MKDKIVDHEIHIKSLDTGVVTLRMIGTTPLYQNRMANKVKEGLLVGQKKKTAAEKQHIKHHPFAEFRNSAEIVPDGLTALGLRTIAIKAAMSTAALETEGIKKSSAQRLLFMRAIFAPLYGTPFLKMDVVRSADINRTPDIRTRCFLPKWGAQVEIQYVVPQLNVTSVVNLLCNAGFLVGVGDFRQEKGKGNYGSFRVLADGQDDEWDELVFGHGRKAQEEALENPTCADRDTEELLEFYIGETKRRRSA